MNIDGVKQLPAGWSEVPLGDLITIIRGVSYKKQDATSKPESGKIPILRATNIDVTLNFVDLVYVPKENVSKVQLLNVGDIVIAASSGSRRIVGKAAALTNPWVGSFGAFCYGLRPHLQATAKYISMYLQTSMYRDHVSALSAGVNINNLRRNHIDAVPLPLAPLNEQHRIVAKIEELFSELDRGIKNLKAARAKLNFFRQTVLKQAFEGKLTAKWREENRDTVETPAHLLARINRQRAKRHEEQLKEWEAAVKKWEAEGKQGKNPSKPRKSMTPDKPRSDQLDKMWKVPPTWQWLQVGNFAFVTKLAGFEYTKFVVYDERGDLSVIKAENAGPNGFKASIYSRVKSESVKHLTRSCLAGNELLMVFVGAGTGNVATVPSDQAYFLGPNIGMIRTETQAIKPRYVELFLRSPLGKQLALASVKSVAQPSLSMSTIRQIPVIVPSTEEQSEIVQELDNNLSAIEAIEAEIDNQLLKADALRQSVLKKAFSGQLVSQDPQDEPASVLLERIKAEREKLARHSHSKDTKMRKTTA